MTKTIHGCLATLAIVVVLQGCRTTAVAPAASVGERAQHDLTNAVVWFQTAAEADAIRRQTWLAARDALVKALSDPDWTAADEQTGDFRSLPPAVIVDVDETVLDNSPLEARFIRQRLSFTPETWRGWVEERKATPVAGALEFAQFASERGVTIFYVTNRKADEEPATRDNLLQVGFPVSEELDVVLTVGEDGAASSKESRRARVASTHRILLLVGDDLGDFTSREGTVDERMQRVRENGRRWGTSWFVLPNPMYGSWERALAAGPSGESPEARKYDALDEALD
jgi:5'-nucleotidase (lipoprotein e(P4) family)